MTRNWLNWIKKIHWFEYISLIIAVVVVFGPIVYLELNLPGKTDDYSFHLRWAQQIVSAPYKVPAEVVAHAGWQWLVWLANAVLDLSWGTAALAVTLGSVILSTGVLFTIFRRKVSGLTAGGLAIGLNLVAPLLFIDPLNNLTYLVNGYIAPNLFHNPTLLLLKPLAMAQFALVLDTLSEKRSGWVWVFATALVSAAAVFSKPSYAICLLPALGLLTLIRLLKKQSVDWVRLVLGVVVPTFIFLIWQFIITYGQENSSAIIFAPLLVMKHYSATGTLPAKLLLSLVFPLVVTLLCWKSAIRSRKIQLGWLGFVISLALVYLLAETGTRQFAANFYWSAELSMFILFAACVWFLIENKPLLDSPFRKWWIVTTGLAHLVVGVTYYYYVVFHLYIYIQYNYWW